MATLGEYIGAGSGTTKLLLHLNGSSADSSGNGNNGTDTNITYSQANGKFGQGAGFAGNGAIVTADIDLDYITYGGWVKFSSSASGEADFFISKDGFRLSQARACCMYLLPSSNLFVSDFWNNSNTYKSVSTPISRDVWYHMITTFDGSNLKLYVNGNLVGSEALTGTTKNNNVAVTLGARNSTIDSRDTLTGSIDEVILENIAWTPQQVAKYYTMTKGRFGII